MAAIDPAAFNAALALIFTNGIGQAGLEVGSDPGLPVDNYIQIPLQMEKVWVAKISDYPTAVAQHSFPTGTQYDAIATDSVLDLSTKVGWITSAWGDIIVHDEKLYVTRTGPMIEIEDFRVQPPTLDDVRAFYTVNVGHIKDAELAEDQKLWVHATRFWSVISGLVTSTKSNEYVSVPNPTVMAPDADVAAAFISDFAENAWTACAARVTSWRKTNHATGGEMASGFPKRWLQKMQYWPTSPDKAVSSRAQRKATTAFYVATHAVSVHATLALMLPTDEHHWAVIDPKYGMIVSWSIGESAKIRMSPRTQVAGAAVVVDSVVVLRMLVKEGLSPMLANRGQLAALMTAYNTVATEGMRCATYAKWFFDGHPDAITAESFSQKDAAYIDISGELATVAIKYYATSTIGQSMSLSNASQQSSDEVAKTTWSALASSKRQASSQQIVQAVSYLKGASAAGTVAHILASDETEVRTAVADYNTVLIQDASTAGLASAPTMNANQVWSANQKAQASTSVAPPGS